MKRFFNNLATAFGALLVVIVAGWVTDGLNGTPILLFSSFLPDYEILEGSRVGCAAAGGLDLGVVPLSAAKDWSGDGAAVGGEPAQGADCHIVTMGRSKKRAAR